MAFTPCLVRSAEGDGRDLIRVGHRLLDAYLELVAARARPNTVLAQAYDLKVFFSVIDKEPAEVEPGDVLTCIAEQRKPRRATNVVRIEGGGAGVASRVDGRELLDQIRVVVRHVASSREGPEGAAASAGTPGRAPAATAAAPMPMKPPCAPLVTVASRRTGTLAAAAHHSRLRGAAVARRYTASTRAKANCQVRSIV